MADLPSPSSNRPTIRGKRYVASTGHYLATLAAERVLNEGGNAIDAGVTAGLCLNVLQPDMTNLGGVAPIILHSKERSVFTISGLGWWPSAARREYFVEECGGKFPRGVLSTVMPAAVDAWLTALKEFGTMSFAQVAVPAIELADNGFPMYDYLHNNLRSDAPILVNWRSSAEVFLPEGRVPKIGEKFFQKDLARTFRRLIEAEEGAASRGREAAIQAARDRFYTGDIAEEITSFNQQEGGFLKLEDLRSFNVEIEQPLTVSYRGYEVAGCQPWCQGPVALHTLKILEGYDPASMRQHPAEQLHLILEALKAAFADRERYYGDPKFVDVPVDGLLSETYAAEWRGRINPEKASPGMPDPGDAWTHQDGSVVQGAYREPPMFRAEVDRDTSYLCVIDEAGNAFSATPSDVARAAPVIPGLGLIPSPRGSQSWLDDHHPSRLEPGKRPRLTPNPGLILKDGTVFATYGSPGLDVQPQAMVQLVVNLIDNEMDVQPAIESPRVASYSFPLSSHPHPYSPGVVRAEGRLDREVVAELQRKGHLVEQWPDWEPQAGALCAAVYDSEFGTLRAGADPRRNSYALGW